MQHVTGHQIEHAGNGVKAVLEQNMKVDGFHRSSKTVYELIKRECDFREEIAIEISKLMNLSSRSLSSHLTQEMRYSVFAPMHLSYTIKLPAPKKYIISMYVRFILL